MRLIIIFLFFLSILSAQERDELILYYNNPTTVKGYVEGLVNQMYIRGEVNNLVLKWGQEKVKQELIIYLENKENGNRFKALWALGDINDPALVRYIAPYLRDNSTYGSRGVAISAIGRQGFLDAAIPLGTFLNEAIGYEDTWFAIVALGKITTNEAADYIEGFLNKNIGYRQYDKAQLILTRIRKYNDGRSKKRMLKQLLGGKGEPFAWAIKKLYQPNSPKVSFLFLRRLCEEELKESVKITSRYISLLELRYYLRDTMSEKEKESIRISRGERH